MKKSENTMANQCPQCGVWILFLSEGKKCSACVERNEIRKKHPTWRSGASWIPR
jgi:DNA-directed RNA polymerase subunit RPC12/RpoP